ncbi:MAG: PQQ-binding-like beta-propeller repeat protein [Flavisolibacter sp.]|nr:PQQ-binding-like beta-propeller repeat protein [Flavisolibacter sp.]
MTIVTNAAIGNITRAVTNKELLSLNHKNCHPPLSLLRMYEYLTAPVLKSIKAITSSSSKNILAILSISLLVLSACKQKKAYTGWATAKGSAEAIHYSSLTEIDTTNVTQLEVSWEYHTGDADTVHHSQIQCNPIVIDGILYGTSPQMKLFAIDAASGKEKWVFNPFDTLAGNKVAFFIMNNSRGVAYWTDGAEDKRIYYTAGSQLYCINAANGKPVATFGDSGRLDLHDGLDRDVKDLFVTSTSAPTIYKDLLITGTRVDEGPAAAPGHIRAFDVRTGKRRWIFHTIPYPGEPGFESWEDTTAYKFIGGANAWSGFSLDVERGILFAPIGSASYDFYGGKRLGNNLFANSLLALDAGTGKRLWHFQQIHHDVWDRDLSSPPALVQLKKEGKTIDAVALTTKSGFVFLFERETGKSIYPIEERPVPTTSDLTGEKLSPTQPYPTKPSPFMRQSMTEGDINLFLSDSSYADIKTRRASYKNDNMWHPPSLQGTIMFPGLDGGSEWGGPSYDPETNMLYVNANEMPWLITSIAVKNKAAAKENYGQAGMRLYQSNCMTCHGREQQGSGNFPALTGAEKKYSLAAFDALLQSGRRMMPAFKQLNTGEREAIASFVLNETALKNKPFVATIKDDPTSLPYSITGYHKFLSKEGYPAISPPWGTLNALDLNTGEWIWKKTLGNDTSFKKAKAPTGTENYGASVVTAGGLLFIGATKDGKFRAFNKRTGTLLWEYNLPAPAYATPAVYELAGRQYIVIACGGGKMGTKSGDSYVAFALPHEK